MHKLGRKALSAILTFALLVGLLPTAALAAETRVTVGNFNVEGDSSTYSYSNGVLTVNNGANLTISTNGQISDRIVIASGAKANITLAGVNITPTDAGTSDGYSGIDLGNGATLNLTLSDDSTNEINGGTSITGLPGPGIHLPEDSTLTINGSGSLEVHGASGNTKGAVGIGGMGSSGYAGGACGNVLILGGTIKVHGGTPTYSMGKQPVDIGGGDSDMQKGGDCNTVIILTPVNSGGGLTIGGGAGSSIGGGNGSNGQGIRPTGDGTYTVYGDLELPCDITIPEGVTVVVPEGTSLTVPKDVTLNNNGTIQKDGGSFINDGTVTGQQPADDRYTINFAEETITIGEGYEVYTEATEGNQIQSGGSITAYIGQTLYIQQTGSETTGRTAISIPARPQAPEISGINISYSTEKLKIPSNAGFSADDLEYTTQGYQTVRKWTAVPESLSLSEMGWTGNQMYIYFRIKATETSFASEATTTGMQIPSRPTAPTSESIWTVRTEKSITISGVSGQEYRCGIGDDWGAWKTISSDSKSIKFEDLEPGTEYTIQNRYQSGTDESYQEQFASFANSTTVITWPLITATSLETGYVGVPYSAQLEAVVAEGTTVSWSVMTGSSLPAGLTLNGNGTISGTPTTAGHSSVTIKVAILGSLGEEKASNMKQLPIIIHAGTSDVSITSSSGTYTYGDTITISGSIAASTTPPASNGINAITEPDRTRWGCIWGMPSLPQRMLERVEPLP